MTSPDSHPQPTHVKRHLALATAMACMTAATGAAEWFPKFEDLRPKWQTLTTGASTEKVIEIMGPASNRVETQSMGVPHLVLMWRDIKGQSFQARFIAGHLYAKRVTE